MSKLENWSLIMDDSNPYQAPELRKIRLQGEVFDREDFNDGDFIHTSSVQELDLVNNIARTRNTVYELGKPTEQYLKWLNDNGKSLEDYIDH
jgi:hypothetical protein